MELNYAGQSSVVLLMITFYFHFVIPTQSTDTSSIHNPKNRSSNAAPNSSTDSGDVACFYFQEVSSFTHKTPDNWIGKNVLRDLSPDRLFCDEAGNLICNIGDVIGGRYKITKTLGDGVYGKVLSVVDLYSPRGPEFVLKIVAHIKDPTRGANHEIEVLELLDEKDPTGSFLSIKMITHFYFYGHLCIVFDTFGKNVYDFLKDNNHHPFPMEHIQDIACQLIHSVNFLHENDLIHTDLKPENVLFVRDAYDLIKPCSRNWMDELNGADSPSDIRVLKDTEIRLIDFGSAVFDHKTPNTKTVTTRYYRAPEVVLGLGWSKPCDVWSIGCILFELYTGFPLFNTDEDQEHIAMMKLVLGPLSNVTAFKDTERFLSGSQSKQIDESVRRHRLPLNDYMRSHDLKTIELFNLIEDMLKYDPDKRLQLSYAIRHSFFKEN